MLSDYGIIEDLRPIGGWQFRQEFNGQEVRIPPEGYADSARDLVSQVRAFRMQNRIELGNVEADIALFIAERSPINDRWKGKPPQRIIDMRSGKKISLPTAECARQWLQTAAYLRPKLVSLYDAGLRVEICASCPHNMALTTGIKPIDAQILQEAKNLRQRAVMPGDEALHFCHLHGMVLAAAVFIDSDSPALQRSNEPAPAECWNKIHASSDRPESQPADQER